MKKTNLNKIKEKQQSNSFDPSIVVGIVGTSDLDSLNKIKKFFQMVRGFKLVYLRTSGSRLYITDMKPKNIKK